MWNVGFTIKIWVINFKYNFLTQGQRESRVLDAFFFITVFKILPRYEVFW